MAFTHPDPQTMFGERNPERLAQRDMAYKASMDQAVKDGDDKRTRIIPGGDQGSFLLTRANGRPGAAEDLQRLLDMPDVGKALGADLIGSLRQSLETNRTLLADVGKDMTLSGLGSGAMVPVAFDLEAPAKMLTPRPTPLRNRIPRTKGIGTSHRFKQITGFSGTGLSGVPTLRPGITETTQTNFNLGGAGALNLIRPQKIAYQSADKLVPYVQMGLSDQISWGLQFAAQGYQDVRALMQTSVLYASMLSEERELIGGRSSAAISGFTGTGALVAPAAVTLTARAAGAGEQGATANITIWVQVTSDAGEFGESVPSATATLAVTAGQVVDVKVGTDAVGAMGYRVYVGSGAADPGVAAHFFQGRSGYNTFTIWGSTYTTGALITGSATPPAADTSASPTDYDGIVPICATQGSYVTRLNSAFTSSSPGAEYEQAFTFMYDTALGGRLADPDEILIAGRDRKQLGELLKTASSANYRLVVTQEQAGSGITVGSLVTAIINEVTGKEVPFTVHPWLPQGNSVILSWTLPIPDTQVTNVWEVVNVQDYMGIQWPVIQMTYDMSSYWFGALCCFAAPWNGIIQGIKAV